MPVVVALLDLLALVGDLLDLALRALAVLEEDDDLLKLARRCVRLAKHIMRDVGD